MLRILIISFSEGLLPVLSIPNLNSLDDNKITVYILNNNNKLIDNISHAPGFVEFKRNNITGTDVRGKYEKNKDNIE